jgi:hypothetical protein
MTTRLVRRVALCPERHTRGRPIGRAPRLDALLGEALAETFDTRPSIIVLGSRPATVSTSYASEILTLRLERHAPIEVFLKDYGHSRLYKADARAGARREIAVYRHLLRDAGLGTAAYYGAVWTASHRWLILESVQGAHDLRSVHRDVWPDAAAWLGRLQRRFDEHLDASQVAFLPRHDHAFFKRQARKALKAVGGIESSLATRLGKVLAGYERLVDLMASQPLTLVHGSFRPQNILVVDQAGKRRICPVDWEHAALGSVLYDLAFLGQGFRGTGLTDLLDAWRRETGVHMPAPDPVSQRYLLDCYRLAKVVRSLGDAVVLRFPSTAVERYVVMAEELRSSLG